MMLSKDEEKDEDNTYLHQVLVFLDQVEECKHILKER